MAENKEKPEEQTADEIITINITEGRAKKASSFEILSDNIQLSKQITSTLETCKRLIKAKSNNDVDITITLAVKNTSVIINISDKNNKKTTTTKLKFSKEVEQQKLVNMICNEIYQAYFQEQGMFDTSLIVACVIDKNVFALGEINYDNDQLRIISSPISFLGELTNDKDAIYITKFFPPINAHGLFKFSNGKFYKVVFINHASVSCPFFINDIIYLSISHAGTKIYAIKNTNTTQTFLTFDQFSTIAAEQKLNKQSDATSYSQQNGICIYSSRNNETSKFAIYRNNTQISCDKNCNYYTPVLAKNKIIARKTQDDKTFKLIIFDANCNEKEFLSQSFEGMSKPAISPCGNWIAFIFKENNQSKIAIVHISGKFLRIIPSNAELTSILWINKIE
jgi:hypothetical protein